MILSLKDFLKEHYNIDGDIVLYRDSSHKKKGLCAYLYENLKDVIGDKEICTISDGAFALYLADAFNDRQVYTTHHTISPDYEELMKAQENLNIQLSVSLRDILIEWIDQGKYYINQTEDSLLKEYYRKHFKDIASELELYGHDLNSFEAFVDCGHSCATLAGIYEAVKEDYKLPAEIILGVFNYSINRGHLNPYLQNVDQYSAAAYDSYEVSQLIEKTYPNFGNLFEGSWSIVAAMDYLITNPNKKVFVYIGDNMIKGEK